MDVIGRFVICRSRDQGVVCGYLKSLLPQPGAMPAAELEEARQIHGWNGETNTLFEAAIRGFLGSARISEPLPEMLMFGVCGVLPCSEEAKLNLSQSRWNEPYNPSDSRPPKTKRPG